ncbi:MAG: AraC family transcriptional regulator [Spirochaetales bacterium]|nr:AraC family transcriptional regulator [Spirochaetales bacterium]
MNEYQKRINRVLDYIENNLDKNLTLEELADVSCFSRFHFARIFSALMGETLFQFIQRVRLEKAASRLAADPREAVINIAMDCGFANASSFSKSFKSQFGVSPSAWRSNLRQVQSNSGTEPGNLNKESRFIYRDTEYRTTSTVWRYEMNKTEVKVEVREVEPMTVAYIRHVGPYAGDAELFGRLFGQLFQWAGPRGVLNDESTKCISIYHDNPEVTDESKLRLSVCVTVPEGTEAEGDINIMTIPGGKYAIGHFELDVTEYGEAWAFLCGEWLASSGYEPDDRPCFEMMMNNPEEHPEGKHIVDIYEPVRPMK